MAEALGPSWASRADATDWPTPCGRARWPDPKHEIWRPDHAGPVALVCYQSPSVVVYFPTLVAALRADREECQLPGCEDVHCLVFTEVGRLHVCPSISHAPERPGLAATLNRLYPRDRDPPPRPGPDRPSSTNR